MSTTTSRISCGALVIGLALASGCTSTQKTEHQFNPVPTAKVGAQELGPAKHRSATDLLKAADSEWRKANEAQDSGDHKGALRHYSQMLEYLSEADLNPVVFEGLRQEFERILTANSETADLFERDHPEFNREMNRVATSDLFKGDILMQQRVQREIDDIIKRYPKNFQAGLDRSWKYRPLIEKELSDAGLPKDLAWLAMVESLYQPSVVSRAGAVGMWQFMEGTGRRYGLRIDGYVDERRDWQKATRAAAGYLKDLHKFHNGAWPLAVASYNMGEGGISRMVAMNGGERDIWRLMDNPPAADHMPEETKKFYPKLAAYWIVATSPTKFGFVENRTPPDAVLRVPVGGSYSLAALERSSGLPGGTLKRLNPDLIRGVTPPKGDFAVAIPAESQEQFAAAIAYLAKEPRKGVKSVEGRTMHVVARGETISKIAEAYGVDADDIVAANKLRLSSRLPVGKKLLIPGYDGEPIKPKAGAESSPDAETKATPKAEPVASTYVVKQGDTLFKIAKAHNISLEELQRINKLDRHARIHVKQVLLISAPTESTSEPASAGTPSATGTHVVKKGDTLAEIANQYGMTLDELLKANNLTRKSVIQVNQKLSVIASSAPESKPEQAAEQPKDDAPVEVASATLPGLSGSHTVVKGDTLSGIASRYGMKLSELRDANGLKSDSVIKTGQKLKVKGDASSDSEDDAEPVKTAAATPSTETVSSASSERAVGVRVHKVVQGETLSDIAAQYKAKVSNLISWNNLGEKAVLHIGQELIVSTPKTSKAEKAAASPAGKATTHKVTEGQSPASIAKRYGVKVTDLFEWNKWEKNHVLHIGDEVIVHAK